jgi:hypothetical protein
MISLKQIWAAGRKAKVNGHAWYVGLSVNGSEAVLTRMVRVKPHLAVGGYKGGGLRWVEIRRQIGRA